MILHREEALSFDDVMLLPQKGILRKREHADMCSTFVEGLELSLPIVSAPMQSVTEWKMAKIMRWEGGMGILHRFLTIEEQIDHWHKSGAGSLHTGVAIGVNEKYERWEALYDAGCRLFCLDIAHAHHEVIKDFLSEVPSRLDDSKIIVGNVATDAGARFLCELGVDAIKIGIGPGAACTTREVTGFGIPQFTAIAGIARLIHHSNRYQHVKIIADGGIKNSGDIVKALAAGADTVMIGRLLAGANESPHPGLYWGMASKRVNNHWAPEGVEGSVPRTGSLHDTLKPLVWGIKSGISYGGATNLTELRRGAEFVRVTNMSQHESKVRI